MFPGPTPEGIKWPSHETDVARSLPSQFLAIEGQAFVLVATQVVKEESLAELNMTGVPLFKTVCHDSKHGLIPDTTVLMISNPGRSFSRIFGPDGRPLGMALPAVVHLRDIDYAKAMIDTVGNYSRPDLLSVIVNPSGAKIVTHME
jgi:nitrilase